MANAPLSGFTISTTFMEDRVGLGVQGEMDILTVPEFGAIVDAVINRGHRFVVLDLAQVSFLGASGLGVIAHGARRLGLSGGELTLRSPSVMVRRMLAITGLDAVLRVEQSELTQEHLGPEQPAAAGQSLMPVEAARDDLAQHLRTLTAIPADNDVVDSVLRLVVALARATVGGADGVSVSLRRHGRLATVAASDQTISDMDADQYATGEGPCVDASVEGRWFHVESLDTETRWPAFTPKARALGINAILSSPLRARELPVGALNIYSRSTAAFTPTDQELAALFATEASAILADAGWDATHDLLAGRIGEALTGRQVIAQAQGIIMQREGLTGDAAYAGLLRASLDAGMPLRECAEDIVASARQTLPEQDSEPEATPHG